MNTTIIRTYSELRRLPTFLERYEYLRLDGTVCEETFGFERYLNQKFYKTPEWKKVRDFVIIRDEGRDLGLEGYHIYGAPIIHHINPIDVNDIRNRSEYLLNPEFLICTTHRTHQAIHYGDKHLLPEEPIERMANDMCPWRK